ncbi:hypothetical protein ACFKHW_03975 [Bradyrhizobium lupini]|uniref:hypothetical protein n=1 Tax=Rhizobium lupini TaxID=136996 RepID=UPI0036724979
MTTGGDDHVPEGDENPFEAIFRAMKVKRENYEKDVLNSRSFQDGLCYLEGIGSDLLAAQSYIRLQGTRYSAAEDYLMFRFASHLSEAVLAITMSAEEGLQNTARRELRFLLEAAVKLSSRDFHADAKSFDERLAVLGDRSKRFEDYVTELRYFDEFEKPGEANAAILSLYRDLSLYVHAAVPQFQSAMSRERKGEGAGMESVSTLNRFNSFAFQVYDIVLVRMFYGLGPSMAGDIFTSILDDKTKWRFHKAPFVRRMSRCFDYKHERRVRRGEI